MELVLSFSTSARQDCLPPPRGEGEIVLVISRTCARFCLLAIMAASWSSIDINKLTNKSLPEGSIRIARLPMASILVRALGLTYRSLGKLTAHSSQRGVIARHC
jgi:hypothetical protein